MRELGRDRMLLPGLDSHERSTRIVLRYLPVVIVNLDGLNHKHLYPRRAAYIDIIAPDHNSARISRVGPNLRVHFTPEPGTDIVIATDNDTMGVGHTNPLEYLMNRRHSPKPCPYVKSYLPYSPQTDIGDGWGRPRAALEDADIEGVRRELERWGLGNENVAGMVLRPRTIMAITSGARRPASNPRRLNSAKAGEKRQITGPTDDDAAIEARVEVDNHADTCVAGRNFRVLYYTNKECQVQGFHSELDQVNDVPVARSSSPEMMSSRSRI